MRGDTVEVSKHKILNTGCASLIFMYWSSKPTFSKSNFNTPYLSLHPIS